MSDPIDREALIDKINKFKGWGPLRHRRLRIMYDCYDIIKSMPSAQPEQRWIPCNERLPEEDDYKSCIECMDGAVWYFTENGTMGLGYYYESVKEWSTTDDLETDGKVVAWMPLPEPYREEGGQE